MYLRWASVTVTVNATTSTPVLKIGPAGPGAYAVGGGAAASVMGAELGSWAALGTPATTTRKATTDRDTFDTDDPLADAMAANSR